MSLYQIDEPKVHNYRKMLEKFGEENETLQGLVEIGRREELLIFIAKVRSIQDQFAQEQFTLDGISEKLLERAERINAKRGVNEELKDISENIDQSISECIRMGLFRKIIN
jgi:hypothetical protein